MKKEKSDIVDTHEIYIRKIFARNLKKLRNDRHMSQMELASVADISTNFINEIEHEKKWPSIETLAKLVMALSVEPAHFFASEIMFKTDNAEMLIAELNSLNTAVAEINKKVDRFIIYTSEIEPDYNRPKIK